MWLYMFWGESFMLTTEPLIKGHKILHSGLAADIDSDIETMILYTNP
jgi:hypothetical protein